jgi:hypothetical protein
LYANYEVAQPAGLVHIYNGAEWKTAVCYIWDGEAWQRALPYIYKNDTDKWQLYSG